MGSYYLKFLSKFNLTERERERERESWICKVVAEYVLVSSVYSSHVKKDIFFRSRFLFVNHLCSIYSNNRVCLIWYRVDYITFDCIQNSSEYFNISLIQFVVMFLLIFIHVVGLCFKIKKTSQGINYIWQTTKPAEV